MKIVCAPDSFKESMTALAAAEAMTRGIHRVDPEIEVVQVPMADGGEGTMDALLHALDGERRTVECVDAIGRTGSGDVGWVESQKLAVIEVAEAVGLADVPTDRRDPLRATSAGVGQLIAAALGWGAERLVVTLGGSATNDGGAGMLHALGALLYTADGAELAPEPGGLDQLARVDLTGLDDRLAAVEVTIASDVTNPLLGTHGASHVFGPQKGADPETVERLDAALGVWASALEKAGGREARERPGAGAAGGIGFALMAVADATTRQGVELVAEAVGLDSTIADADWVFTGEGSIDSQTADGKTPWGVAQVAARHGVPTVLFGGRVLPDAQELLDGTIVGLVPVTTHPLALAEALAQGEQNLEAAAHVTTRMILAARRR